MKENKVTNYQAMVYVYDLSNCAKEFGFKNDEVWELNVVSDTGRKEIEKMYHPTVSIKVLPEMLSELFKIVKQHSEGIINFIEGVNSPSRDLEYLVAYNLKRFR